MYLHHWNSFDLDDRWFTHAITAVQIPIHVIQDFTIQPGADMTLDLAEYIGGKDVFHELFYQETLYTDFDKSLGPTEWGPGCSR